MNDSDDLLRLAAIDEEDLAVISAHVQDAVLHVGDMRYLPAERRFAIAMNRFIWEVADGGNPRYQRRRACVTFDRVNRARTRGIDRDRPEAALELLAMRFQATDSPAGLVTLVFAGGGAVQLSVEVIEARLADLCAAWPTTVKPSHDLAGGEVKSGA